MAVNAERVATPIVMKARRDNMAIPLFDYSRVPPLRSTHSGPPWVAQSMSSHWMPRSKRSYTVRLSLLTRMRAEQKLAIDHQSIRRFLHPINSDCSLPSRKICTGRPLGVCNSWCGSMPVVRDYCREDEDEG